VCKRLLKEANAWLKAPYPPGVIKYAVRLAEEEMSKSSGRPWRAVAFAPIGWLSRLSGQRFIDMACQGPEIPDMHDRFALRAFLCEFGTDLTAWFSRDALASWCALADLDPTTVLDGEVADG